MISAPTKSRDFSSEREPSQNVRTADDLDVAQFSDLIQSLKNVEPAGDGQEQRRQPRAELLARATIIPLGQSADPGDLAILVRNLSPAGIGFLHESKMNLGEEFALVLPKAGDTPAIVLCAVASWQPLARDLFSIGAQFMRILRDGGESPLPIEFANYLLPQAHAHFHRQAS